MAVTATPFWQFINSLAQKRINFPTDTLKVALVGSAYVPDLDAHDFFNDITSEVTGTGYTAGGATLASVTWVYSATTDAWTLDAADVSWPTSTITARYAVVYDSTPGTATTNPLICLIDFGADVTTSAGALTIAWNASAILTIGKP